MLCHPWGRVALVLGGGLLADACLPLTGHRMVSHDCGEHLAWTTAGLGVLFAHFAFRPIVAVARRLRRKEVVA